ncbi:MAG: hypothetical protein ACI4JY_05710, partial [Oscillospiraceae bacterium]
MLLDRFYCKQPQLNTEYSVCRLGVITPSSGKQDIAGKDKGSGNGDSFAKKIEGTERGRSLSGVLQ